MVVEMFENSMLSILLGLGKVGRDSVVLILCVVTASL